MTERKGSENDNEEKPKKKSHQCKIKDLERKKFFNRELKAETFLKLKCKKKPKQWEQTQITSEFNLCCYPSKAGNS